jgi:hypothetical protein
VLIVFNHPFWDEAGIGEAAHIAIVKRFLAQNGVWIHALELNGLRRWSENRKVIELGQIGRYPLISGGDRHGCEPSAVINLTDARSFDEFVAEIRCDRVSDVLFLPRYRFSPALRIADMVCDALREYPQQVGREHFSDRVFCRVPGESERPLSSYWNGAEPLPIRLLLRAVKLLKRHSDWAMPQQSVRAPREISQSAR